MSGRRHDRDDRRSDVDDFWGDVPDWSGASTSRRSGRSRIGADEDPIDPTPIGRPRPTTGLVGSIRTAVDGFLSGGADSTREHRLPDLSQAPDLRDDHHLIGADDRDLVGADDHDLTGTDEYLLIGADEPVGERAEPTTPSRSQRMTARAVPTPEQLGGRDPLLARLGSVIVIVCLVIPLLLAVARSGDQPIDSSEALASATEQGLLDVSPTTVPQVVEAPAPTQPAASTAPLDPSSLPPAVPVNTLADENGTAASPAATGELDDVASSTGESAEDEPTTRLAESSAGVDEVSEPADVETAAARVDPPVCPQTYVIVSGDFWLRLADAANVPLADLLEVNRATTSSPLFVGNEICLPEGATTPAPPTTVPPTTAPPTTAAPTTTPTTVAPPSTEPPGPEDIKQIVRDVWPDDLEDRALEIVFRESRFVPTAKNFCCYGLFQIYWEVHDVWLVDLGITSASQLYDPETNARAALALYERAGGWGPWGF